MVYSIRMGRTNIEIDESLIRKARKLTRLKTKRQIVDRGAGSAGAFRKPQRNPQVLRKRHLARRSEVLAEKSGVILVDSSVWVDFFSSSPGPAGAELRRMIEESEPFALTGIVIAEVLQGLTRDAG